MTAVTWKPKPGERVIFVRNGGQERYPAVVVGPYKGLGYEYLISAEIFRDRPCPVFLHELEPLPN